MRSRESRTHRNLFNELKRHGTPGIGLDLDLTPFSVNSSFQIPPTVQSQYVYFSTVTILELSLTKEFRTSDPRRKRNEIGVGIILSSLLTWMEDSNSTSFLVDSTLLSLLSYRTFDRRETLINLFVRRSSPTRFHRPTLSLGRGNTVKRSRSLFHLFHPLESVRHSR